MRRTVPYIAALLLAVSCSTTRSLAPDQSRLARNEITVLSDRKITASDISPYIKQQANGRLIGDWSPLLCVYGWGGIFKKIGTEPVIFDSGIVPGSVDNIRKHLEYLGYYDALVKAEVSTRKQLTHVNYIIEPGDRKTVTKVEYYIPEGEFYDEFMSDIDNSLVREGVYLSEDLLEQESVRCASYFRNLGYYDFSKSDFSFVADTVTDPGNTVLKYTIGNSSRKMTKYRIGDVSISHSSDILIKPSILKNLNTLHPGDLYSEQNVNNTYSRLSSLKLFNSVSVEMNSTDSATVDCNISLKESELKGFKTNLELSSNSSGLVGVTPKLTFYHKNLFHGGEWLNINLSGNFLFKLDGSDVHSNEFGISSSLSLPRFVGLPFSVFKGGVLPRTEVKLSFNYQNRPEFTRSIASGSYGYTGSLSRTLGYQLYPLQLNFVRMLNVSESFRQILIDNPYLASSYISHMDAGIGGTLINSSSSDVVPKGSYHIERILFDLSGNFISIFDNLLPQDSEGQRTIFGSPYAQYVRFELNLSRGINWGRNNGQTLAARFLAGGGFAYGNSSAMPYEKQFYSGGANSLRGWQAKAVGPGFSQDYSLFTIPNQTGDLKLEANLEYRFRMFWKLEGALFADAGNIWKIKADKPESIFRFEDFYKSLAADWGLGIRVNLDFILLRVDAGFQIHNPSRPEGARWISPAVYFKERAYAIHFGVGYPF